LGYSVAKMHNAKQSTINSWAVFIDEEKDLCFCMHVSFFLKNSNKKDDKKQEKVLLWYGVGAITSSLSSEELASKRGKVHGRLLP